MDGPGLSLFQSSGMSVLQGPNQRQEEDEFLADENERKAELNHLIGGAFDDLIDDVDDDDDASVSSGYSHSHRFDSRSSRDSRHTSYEEPIPERSVQENFTARRESSSSFNGFHCAQHRDRPVYVNGSNLERYKESDLNGYNQLKVLYDVRLAEIERLTAELQAEKSKKEQILKRLDTVEKEKNGIFGTLNANQGVLVKSKDKIDELQKELQRYKNELNDTEKAKNETKRELDLARLQIIQLEQEMTIMERCDVRLNREKQIDEVIETLNDKHKKEMNELQKDLNLALEKILKKDEAYQFLEKKLDELEKKHVATLLNRCDSVTQQDETVRALLKESEVDKERLQATIVSLQKEVDSLRGDLSQFESVAKMRLFASSPSGSSDDGERDSAVVCSSSGGGSSRRRLLSKMGESYSVSSDLVGKLKDELHRALIGQQAKREEIKKLQHQLLSKEVQINKMREQEKSYLTETDQLKTDMLLILEKLDRTNMSSSNNEKDEQLNAAREELNKYELELSSANDKLKNLEAQVQLLQVQLDDERLSGKKHTEEYSRFYEKQLTEARQESKIILSEKENEWKQKMDSMLSENDEVKRLYLEVHSSKEQLVKILNEEKSKNKELEENCTKLKKEIDGLHTTVNSLENHIISLTNERRDQKTASTDEATVMELKQEIERLKAEARPSEAELLELKTQVADARARYVKLERTLKDEFEASVSKLKAENGRLKEEVAKTAQEIESLTEQLAKKPSDTVAKDCATAGDTSYVSHMDVMNQLEAEVDRLKALELSQAEEICRLKTDFQKSLQERLEVAETAIWDKHRKEIDSAITQAKTITAQFFAGKLQEERERLEGALQEERSKIEELRKEIGLRETQMKENEEVKERLVTLQRDSEEYKRKANGLLHQWAAELESIKAAKEAAQSQLNETRSKVDRLKKTALKYKKMYEQVREASLPEKYQALVDLVSVKEREIIEKIGKIEEYYKSRAPQLAED